MTNDVVVFINKVKKVFNLLSDEEIDIYNEIYNDYPTQDFIAYINKKYEELYLNKLNK